MDDLLRKIKNVFNIITDWFLILTGVLLISKAFFGIDVLIARTTVIVAGGLFMGAGLWFRYRRIRRS